MYFLNLFFFVYLIKKTRTFTTNLRHNFLHLDLNSMSVKFQWLNSRKNVVFNFLVHFQEYSFIHSNVIHIIR